MRNLKLVLVFVSGVALGLLLSRVVPQPAWAQTVMVKVSGAVPVVPTRRLIKANRVDALGPGYALEVDGLDCVDCKIENGGVIQYGGGAFKLTNFQRSGVATLELNGAALNTKILLSALGLIGCPVREPNRHPTGQNAPALKTASTRLETIDLLFSPVEEK